MTLAAADPRRPRSAPSIRAAGVGKRFRAAGAELVALDGLDVDVRPGEFLSIIGGSGCGKSTFLRILAGLERHDAGSISVDGAPVAGPSLERGIMFQDSRLLPWLTVERNVAFALSRVGTFTFFSFFVIPLAIERHQLAAAAAAGLLVANTAALVLALLTLGGVASRGGRGRRAVAAHGSAAAGLLLLGLARSGAWLYAGSLVLGVGLGLVQLDNLVRSARVGGRVGQGAASGLQILAGSAGGLVGGVLGGALDVRLVFLLLAPTFAWLGARSPAAPISSASPPGPDGRGTAPSRSPASSCGPGGCAG